MTKTEKLMSMVSSLIMEYGEDATLLSVLEELNREAGMSVHTTGVCETIEIDGEDFYLQPVKTYSCEKCYFKGGNCSDKRCMIGSTKIIYKKKR